METKAFAYVRVSGRGQIDGDGFPRQTAAIKAYAKANNIRIVEVFQEKAVTGAADMVDRPAFVRMMEALLSNGTRLVLVEKLDRLARDLMIQETILGDLRKRGIELVSVMEPDLCSQDPTRVLMRQVFGAISQYEKSMIVLKLRGARNRIKARTGRCEGQKFYGEVAGEAPVLERIVSMRSAGATLEAIAKTLNDEGIPTRRGRRWYPMTIANIVRHSGK